MPRSQDVEAQKTLRAGQYQISVRPTPESLILYVSQSGIQNEGGYGAQVRIIGTKTELQRRTPTVRSHQLAIFLFLTRSDYSPYIYSETW